MRPLGVAIFGTFFKFNNVSAKRTFHKALVLYVTFLAYTCYHMGRRPLSIVKNVLNRNCSELEPTENPNQLLQPPSDFDNYNFEYDLVQSANSSNWCDWSPFDNDATANQLLALLDSAFLFAYAFFMFISGFLADRCNLRYFLAVGMLLSGLSLYAFGLAYYLNIHSMTYFILVQIFAGIIQTSGWPAVVACVGNWFEPSSRGAIFGVWNSHTNLGNILGATISGYFVERSWGLSFMVPGFIMLISAVVVFLFLVPRPEDVGLPPIRQTDDKLSTINGYNNHQHHHHHHHNHDHDHHIHRQQHSDNLEEGCDRISGSSQGSNDLSGSPSASRATSRRKPIRVSAEIDSAVTESTDADNAASNNSEQSPLILNQASGSGDIIYSDPHAHQTAASFWTCLKIPGVVEYSLCLGFAKLVSYTFLYWLPRYISQSTSSSSEQSAYLSVPFDLGGMFGAILAGVVSDRSRKSGLVCVVMLILAIPAMFIYEKYAHISNLYNVLLQLLAGALVNGPYALITTAVSADLGNRIKDGNAMATVAAIIDGTGSIGAAIGPLFAGYVSDSGWKSVFLMLMVSDLLAFLCLARIALKELGYRV